MESQQHDVIPGGALIQKQILRPMTTMSIHMALMESIGQTTPGAVLLWKEGRE